MLTECAWLCKINQLVVCQLQKSICLHLHLDFAERFCFFLQRLPWDHSFVAVSSSLPVQFRDFCWRELFRDFRNSMTSPRTANSIYKLALCLIEQLTLSWWVKVWPFINIFRHYRRRLTPRVSRMCVLCVCVCARAGTLSQGLGQTETVVEAFTSC